MRTQTGGTVALPGRHCWRASVLHAALYSENFLSTYNLDYESIKTGDSEYPRAEWSRAGGPVASTYRAVVGCVRWRCTQSNPGVPGPTHTGTLHRIHGNKSPMSHLRASHPNLLYFVWR